ncbi:MAG: ribonuclease Z [Muribaculaceae bacterium]|nr:ribonuclease Z [Muribaculaceae bacterium]
MTKFELNILGCGSATSTLRHRPSCQVLNVRDNLFMIDCGEGSQLEMRRMGLKFSRLNHIFISHLHGDHCLGLIGLISTISLLDRKGSLTLHMFKEGVEEFKRELGFFCPHLAFEVKFNVIGPKKAVIYEDHAITVTTIPLLHRVPAVGFIFAEKTKFKHINRQAVEYYNIPTYALNAVRAGDDFVAPDGTVIANELITTPADLCHNYAYCSDTKFSRRVINAVKGVEWLYHESTYGDDSANKAVKRYHSTSRQAAMVAKEAGVKKLILGHFSKRYVSEQPLLDQAKEVFPNTILANEGMTIDLNNI